MIHDNVQIERRDVDQSLCEAYIGNTRITDLVLARDAVILAELLKVLVIALSKCNRT